MKKIYEFNDFVEIIETLRSEEGCPWDREQTHGSLKKCLIEEAYEVIEGIDRFESNGDSRNLKEELGDLLLQVVMHSQIAKEEGVFTMQDVIQEISQKMIRRHPHVFQNKQEKDVVGVLEKWEEIKREEKKARSEEDSLRSVPRAFPALLRASKVLKKAEKLQYVQEKDMELISSMSKIIEDLRSNSEQEVEARKQEYIGALLLDISKLARRYNVDTEEALSNAIEEFITNHSNQRE